MRVRIVSSIVAAACLLGAASAQADGPSITGTPTEGETLTAVTGSWATEDFTSTAAATLQLTRQWQACDSSGCVNRGTGATHVLTESDVGKQMQVRMDADVNGWDKSATSARTATVAAAPEPEPEPDPGHPACAVYASPTGSDSNPGTATQPFRTFLKLANSTPDGTSGCLREGTYTHSGNANVTNGGTTSARVVIRSYPGEQATINGRVVLTSSAANVTFYRLKLTAPAGAVNSPVINAANFELSDSEVTNGNTGICMQVGSSYGNANNAWIHHNYIHHCGRLPRTNHDHGIYVSGSNGFVIEDNIIVSNADRGVQLYGDNNNGQIRHNVISHNGSGVIISGVAGGNTDNTVIRNNVITFAQARYNVESYWGDTSGVGTGNQVINNCVFGGAQGNIQSPYGFTASGNVTADPQFAAGTWTPTNATCAAVLEAHTPGIRDGSGSGGGTAAARLTSTDSRFPVADSSWAELDRPVVGRPQIKPDKAKSKKAKSKRPKCRPTKKGKKK